MNYIFEAEINYYHYCKCTYSGNKERLCDVCIFVNDLIQYKDVLEDNLEKNKHCQIV